MFNDLRYAVRMLMKNPGFSAVAIITLALGIGANTALFTVFDVFVLKPLPLKDPGGLVNIRGIDQRGSQMNLFSYLDYLDYRDRNTTLSGLIAMNKVAVAVGEVRSGRDDLSVMRDETGYVFGQIVSANYFSVLGAEMALGRGFLLEEDRTPGTHPVVVLSHYFWQRQFNGDPSIIGKTIKLQSQPFTIIGVTVREFIGTSPDAPACWLPLMMRDAVISAGRWNHKRWLTERDADSFTLLGRLKPGVSQAQAHAELSVVAQQLAEQHSAKDRKTGVRVKSSPGFIALAEDDWVNLIPLPLAVALVLLIACANVANLLLARAAMRQREIGVRLALGASRWHVVRHLLTESALVSVVGGLAGLLLAMWTLSTLYPIILSRLPIPAVMRDSITLNLDPDYRIFGFTMLISLIAGIVAGLAPALQASRPDLTSALKEEGSTFGYHLSQSRLRKGLIVTQIAVCLMLLIGAGLLVRNLLEARKIETGIESKNLFSVVVNLISVDQEYLLKQTELRRQLAGRLRALPGVKSVSQALRQPLTGVPASTPITIAGQDGSDGRPLRANYNFVSPSYFETLGIPVARGRSFTEQEVNSNAPVVVISEATVRKFWPGFRDVGEAIGQDIGIGAAALSKDEDNQRTYRIGDEAVTTFPSYEVIGIARDTRSGWVWQKDETYLYVALRPDHHLGEYLMVKTVGDPRGIMAMVRSEAEALDPHLTVAMQRTEENLDVQMTPFRVVAMIGSVLGLLALLLASIGLYGVMSFVVTQRTRESGIRVALGAEPRDVVTLFLKQGLRLIIVGIVIGLVGGAVISRLLAAALVNLSPLDPVAFGCVSVFLMGVALLACYLPARRATKVDPMVALRYE